MKRVEDCLKALETLKKALTGWGDAMSVGMVLWSNDGWVEDSGIRKHWWDRLYISASFHDL